MTCVLICLLFCIGKLLCLLVLDCIKYINKLDKISCTKEFLKLAFVVQTGIL